MGRRYPHACRSSRAPCGTPLLCPLTDAGVALGRQLVPRGADALEAAVGVHADPAPAQQRVPLALVDVCTEKWDWALPAAAALEAHPRTGNITQLTGQGEQGLDPEVSWLESECWEIAACALTSAEPRSPSVTAEQGTEVGYI